MKNLKSTVGFLGDEGVILKDHSTFKKGDVVIVISAESFDEFLKDLKLVKAELDDSKKWINEIKEMNTE